VLVVLLHEQLSCAGKSHHLTCPPSLQSGSVLAGRLRVF